MKSHYMCDYQPFYIQWLSDVIKGIGEMLLKCLYLQRPPKRIYGHSPDICCSSRLRQGRPSGDGKLVRHSNLNSSKNSAFIENIAVNR